VRVYAGKDGSNSSDFKSRCLVYDAYSDSEIRNFDETLRSSLLQLKREFKFQWSSSSNGVQVPVELELAGRLCESQGHPIFFLLLPVFITFTTECVSVLTQSLQSTVSTLS
jgi:hypothetical protein